MLVVCSNFCKRSILCQSFCVFTSAVQLDSCWVMSTGMIFVEWVVVDPPSARSCNAIVHSKKKKLILDNHNLSVDTNADRCTTLLWCYTDQRRRRRCLAQKRSSCSGTGSCSEPLPSEHCCVWPLKVLFLVTEHFQASQLLFFRVG